MDIPYAQRKEIEHGLREYLAVRAGDHDVSAQRPQRRNILAQLFGLKDGNTPFRREAFDGRRRQYALPTLRLIRLDDGADHLVAALYDFFKGLYRKQRSARKYDLHDFFPFFHSAASTRSALSI